MKYLYGKSVFLTGGSSGIGHAAAELFAANGYTVFAASRNPPDNIRSYPGGGEIRPVTMDVRDPQSVATAVDSVLSQCDAGIVIHCAGMGIACAAEDYPAEAVTNLLETNFNGVMRVNSHILPHFRKRGLGLCVIIGSMAGVFPIPFQSHYSASKAALDSYSAALRMELRAYGVKVSLVLPGDTNTGFTSARQYVIDESSPYYCACIKAVKKMEKDELGGNQPITAARAILRISSKKKPPSRKIIGLSYKLLNFLGRLLPDSLIEYILRKMYLGAA